VVDFRSIAEVQKANSELQDFRNGPTSLQLKDIPLHITPDLITCDVSTGLPRLFDTKAFQHRVFRSLQNLSHSGKGATAKLVLDRFIWPYCRKDIANCTKTCQECQRAKADKHTKTPLGTFPLPYFRFDHVYIDIVGPLPLSNVFSFLLKCVDRFSRWQDTFPMRYLAAETVARIFAER
ncbi:unnamed protein product, partial [Hymenolepis diminuta]